MELWIRSQDKMILIKVEELSLGFWRNDAKTDINARSQNYYETVGTYTTKERALEVLDEIQKKINLINLGHDFGSPMIDLKNPTYIYEMPKE